MPTSHRTRREAEAVLFLKSERIGFFTSRGTVGELDFGGIDLAALDTTPLHALKRVKDVRFAHTLHVEKLVGFIRDLPGLHTLAVIDVRLDAASLGELLDCLRLKTLCLSPLG